MTGQVLNKNSLPARCLVIAGLLAATSSHAYEIWRDPARANKCFMEASQRTGVPYNLLLAVKIKESGVGFDPFVSRRNTNGSKDIGMMQINTVWLPMLSQFGVEEVRLYDPCVNVDVASRILAFTVAKEGDWVRGIARYHTGSSKSWQVVQERGLRYAGDVIRIYQRLNTASFGN